MKSKKSDFSEFSKIRLKINKFYFYIFGEKFYKKLDFDWSKEPHRSEIINYIIQHKNYKNYCEIGVRDKSDNFDKIKILKKIGVDPLSGGEIKLTSDDFFENNKIFFDVFFIDGLHIYEQVIRDINNSIKFLNEGGCVILHDCLPRDNKEQFVPRCKNVWTGDVWKAIVKYRTFQNLDIYTLFADMGLSIIFKRNNQNKINIENKNFKDLKFKYYFENYRDIMNLINFEDLKNVI